MAASVLSITNIETKTDLKDKLPLAKAKPVDKTKIIWENIETDPKVPESNVLEISLKDGNNSYTLRGSKTTYDNKTFTVDELAPVAPFGVNFAGKIEIKDPKAKDADPPAAILSVRIGNMGKDTRGQWIIDLSDKTDGGGGSKLNVSALLVWIQGQAKTEKPELPPMENAKQLEDLVVVFDEFHFNVTNKTFDIDVHTEGSLKIGAFEIKKVALRLTNEPPKELPA